MIEGNLAQVAESEDARLHQPRLHELHAYWARTAEASGGVPHRAEIDPIDIPHLLPDLYVVQYHPANDGFYVRLAGTRLVELRGDDPTGKYVGEDLHGPAAPLVDAFFRRVLAERRPLGVTGRAVWVPGKEWAPVEALALPMRTGDAAPDEVLGCYLRDGAPATFSGGGHGDALQGMQILTRPVG